MDITNTKDFTIYKGEQLTDNVGVFNPNLLLFNPSAIYEQGAECIMTDGTNPVKYTFMATRRHDGSQTPLNPPWDLVGWRLSENVTISYFYQFTNNTSSSEIFSGPSGRRLIHLIDVAPTITPSLPRIGRNTRAIFNFYIDGLELRLTQADNSAFNNNNEGTIALGFGISTSTNHEINYEIPDKGTPTVNGYLSIKDPFSMNLNITSAASSVDFGELFEYRLTAIIDRLGLTTTAENVSVETAASNLNVDITVLARA